MEIVTKGNITFSRVERPLSSLAPVVGFFLACWITLYFLSGWLSEAFLPQIRATLTKKEQMFWRLACVRAILGLSTIWAFRLRFIDKDLTADPVMASTEESWLFLSIIGAFFFFEESSLIYFDLRFKTFSKELHVHHIVAVVGFCGVALTNRGHAYAIQSIVLEMSTPFSCICWCLLKLKMERTFAWKANQMALIYVFHFRTIYELYWWYDLYHHWDNVRDNLSLIQTCNMLFGLTAVTVWLTPYWTYKKTVQFFNPTDWNTADPPKKGEIKSKKEETKRK